MRRISILYVIGQLGIGGAEKQLLELVRRLDQERYKIYVCSLWPRLDLAPDFERAGVELVRVHKRSKFDLGVVFELAACMKALQIDIVQTWLFTGNTWGRLAAVMARVPIIIASERQVEDWKGRHHIWVDKALARRTDLIIGNSQRVLDFVEKTVRVRPERCRLIYNGVDLERFVPCDDPTELQERKRRLGVNPRAPVVGMVANLNPWKNHRDLLQAARRVRNTFPRVEFACVGEGSERESLERYSRELGLGETVKFLGTRHDIGEVVSAFDVKVLCSHREGFSNVILEAMALAKPVVATNVGGNSEAVADGETGFIVPPRNPDALTAAIMRLLSDRPLRERMGNLGRRRAECNFGLQRMVERTALTYEQLIREKSLED